jgi:hypothetical protein
MTGRYIRKPTQRSTRPTSGWTERVETHRCDLPAEWPPDAIWQCGEGHVWVTRSSCHCGGSPSGHVPRAGVGYSPHNPGMEWAPVSLVYFMFLTAMGTVNKETALRPTMAMANGNRVQPTPKPKPPGPR